MEDHFGIASFRSRQQVMSFERDLRKAGVRAAIITTPRNVSVGCGLSVQFPLSDSQRVAAAYRISHPENLIGFYHVTRDGQGRTEVKPLGMEGGYGG